MTKVSTFQTEGFFLFELIEQVQKDPLCAMCGTTVSFEKLITQEYLYDLSKKALKKRLVTGFKNLEGKGYFKIVKSYNWATHKIVFTQKFLDLSKDSEKIAEVLYAISKKR